MTVDMQVVFYNSYVCVVKPQSLQGIGLVSHSV